MAYIKPTFRAGEVLTAAQMNNLVEGINTSVDAVSLIDPKKTNVVISNLVDTKEHVAGWESVWDSSNYEGTSMLYTPSTFSGWGGQVHAAKPISRIITNGVIVWSADKPVSEAVITFYEVPSKDSITEKGTGTFAPLPSEWTTIYSETFKLPTYNTPQQPVTFTFDLKETVDIGTKNTYLTICFNGYVKWGVYRTANLTSIPNATFCMNAAYTTDGSTTNWAGLYSSTWTKEESARYLLPVSLYAKGETTYTDTVGTNSGDKFYTLTESVLTNSGIKDSVTAATEVLDANFDKVTRYKASANEYQTQDLTVKNPSIPLGYELSSTFTGELWYAGAPTKVLTASAISFGIRCRAKSTSPITKIYGYVYSVQTVPLKSTAPAFSKCSPTLLTSGSCEITVQPGETAVATVKFPTAIAIPAGTHLMVGYNGNYSNGSTLNACYSKSFNSALTTYVQFTGVEPISYYAVDTNDLNVSGWYKQWTDSIMPPFQFVEDYEAYELGETITKVIDERMEAALADIPKAVEAEISLPKYYDLVVGDTFQLFYYGCVKSWSPLSYGIFCKCSKGTAYPRYWQWKPTAADVGEYTLTLSARRLDGSIISTGETTIRVNALPTYSAATTINMLCFGDSLTVGGQWPCEATRRLVGTTTSGYTGPASCQIANLSINTFGKKVSKVNSWTAHHEGYGGWTWQSFLAATDVWSTTNGIIVTCTASHGYNINTVQKSVWVDNNGYNWELEDFPADNKIKFNRGSGNTAAQKDMTLPTSLTCAALSLTQTGVTATWESGNPFYNDSTSSVDFAWYQQKYGVSKTDVVACLLTWNAGGGTSDGSFEFTQSIKEHMNNATTLLRKIHEGMPDAKIIVMGLQINSLNGGCGANYGANGGYADMWSTAMYAFAYDEALEQLVSNTEFGAYCYYVDTKGQFDTVNNMPSTSAAVNTRSTKTETLGTNGVHPDISGYYQIADGCFRALVKVLNDIKQ